MATRLEPYRDYSEHEVVNMYSLKVESSDVLSTFKAGTSGKYDAGVVVGLGDSVLPGDLPGFAAAGSNLREYLGAEISTGHVGVNGMPLVEMTVVPAVEGGGAPVPAIGIMLKQTLAFDENGENLLRYPLKKDELQAVTPGQAVPILTRGLILLSYTAFESVPDAGDTIELAETAGLLDKGTGGGAQIVGRCLATGPDTVDLSASGGPADASTKYLCKLSF
tara:strand:- start:24302 stop:24964 length:663 start_codon:yes stop_codon:yes gene_type:complete